MASLQELKDNARVTVRRDGEPRPGGHCVVYWMQRAQRAHDNPALDVAVQAANALKLPCVMFFAPVPFYPHANLRHYAFLQQGIGDIAEGAEKRGVGFVLRRFPQHSLIKFCDEVRAALVVGDENPLRETKHWREVEDITEGWDLDRSVKPVDSFRGGTKEAMRLLHEFVTHKLPQYPVKHNQAHEDGTTRLSPYLHFGHIGPHTVTFAVEKAKAPQAAKDDFLDQLITWRELSINMVHFNPVYDSIECGENWAHKTLAEHAKDPRPILYTPAQLERGETYDDLWNAAQFQMVYAGWMHNY